MSDDKLRITPKHLKGEDGYKTFSIRIKEEIVYDIGSLTPKIARSQ